MTPDLPLTLYVDRSCPLCAREVRWLERQADPTRLRLVDISAAGFDPAGLGVDLPQLRRRLHARSASGIWLTGVDATYWSWRLAGHGRWAAPLGWRPLRPVLRRLPRLQPAAPPSGLATSPRRRTALCGKMCCSIVQAQSESQGRALSGNRYPKHQVSSLTTIPQWRSRTRPLPLVPPPACRQCNEPANRSAGE